MDRKPIPPAVSARQTSPDPSTIPGFANVIRGLAHVPKAEVDAAIAKEKADKKRDKKK